MRTEKCSDMYPNDQILSLTCPSPTAPMKRPNTIVSNNRRMVKILLAIKLYVCINYHVCYTLQLCVCVYVCVCVCCVCTCICMRDHLSNPQSMKQEILHTLVLSDSRSKVYYDHDN